MKQYVIKITGKETEKVPLSRCLPPETGCGCINTPHGGRNLIGI
nr:MAG TPA: hypothetical protein [Caudoviricetes sp.]